MRYWVTVASLLTISAARSFGSDWPQWRSPDRNAISQESGLLQEWPQDGPSLAWKITGLGGGYSAPSISAGRIFGMSNRGGDEVVWALSERDGKEQWVTRLGPVKTDGMPQGSEGPGCTPTVDGDQVYILGAGGALACPQVEDGTIIWQRTLTEDLGGVVPTWRYNESPLVDGDKVICTPGGPEATLVALDKMTGKTIWKSQVPDAEGSGGGRGSRGRGGSGRRGPRSGAAYASAIAIDVDGQRQYVQLTASTLVGVAASDGEVLWRYDQPANSHRINCSSPLYHDGVVFAASAYGNGGGAVKLKTDAGGSVTAEEVYFARKMQNHHGGMIVFDGALYGTGAQFLVCHRPVFG